MKISEFREKLKQCSREDSEKIAAEIYKLLPKSKKEDADAIIEGIISGEIKSSASAKKQIAFLDFESLKNEINLFIENVDNDYYYIPNRIVPKAKRSKWRFEVKRFIKAINEVPVDDENGNESAKLLRELYKRLSYGCGYYIFPSEDPFQSVGIEQADFYEMLVKRTFATGFTDEKIKNMLDDATSVYLDRNTLYSTLERIFVYSLPTSDLKYKALEFIKENVENLEIQYKKEPKYSSKIHHIKCNIEELCETFLIISLILCEPEDAVKFFWEHDKESKKEITLYKMMEVIFKYGDKKTWVNVYEDALKNNIEPRDTLKEYYEKIK